MLQPLRLDGNALWKQRYRVTMILWAQLARSAISRGVISTNKSGQNQLYAWDVNSGTLRQLTYRTAGTAMGSISPDGRYIYFLNDDSGNEIGHWVRVPFEGGNQQDITPNVPPYSSFGLSLSLFGNLIGLTIAQADGFHVGVLALDNGNISSLLKELYHTRKMVFGPTLSYDGQIAAVTSTERTTFQHQSLIAFDTATGRQIAELWEGQQAGLIASLFAPLPGDSRLLATTNRTGWTRPVIWNPLTGGRIDLTFAELPGDVSPLDWSPDGQRLLLSNSYQAVHRLVTYDLNAKSLTPLRYHSGILDMTYFASDNEIFALWEDSTHPTQLIALDSHTGQKTRTVLPAGEVPPGHPWQSIQFISADGQVIQGWLGLPDGKGPFPTILHTHGGPEVQTTDSYIPSSQAWLDHGFAFLAINYRGSTGFGREFREKIWGNLGHWEIEDMVSARHWLVKEGIADSGRILLTGWSYGGYLTLLALGKRPDLWAGGMAGMATTDWAAEYEYLSPTLRGYSVAIFGGTPREKPAQYAASSPITYAHNIGAPVLIIQGRNDTRTPARPVEVYEAKLKSLGKDIEVHWYDEGHAGGGVEQDIQHMELMLRFAYRVVG